MNRREFMKDSLIISSSAVIAATTASAPFAIANESAVGEGKEQQDEIGRPTLPYPFNGLEPYISANTFNYHYLKHYQGYLSKTKSLITGTNLETMAMEDIIRTTVNQADKADIYNNAAQTWNHEFFWNSLSPNGGKPPQGALIEAINVAFGSFSACTKLFAETALKIFGSGWAWIVADADTLVIEGTSNADTPIAHNRRPLLTIDVWEHAYYLDYQNRRAEYINSVVNKLLNWEFAAINFSKKL